MDAKHVNREVFRIDEFTEFMILKNLLKRTIKTYTQIVVHIVAWWISLPQSTTSMSDDVVKKCLLYRFEYGMD